MKKSGAGFHAGELQATHGAKGIMADLRRLRKDPKHRSPIKFCAYGMFKKNAATVLACSVLIGACTPVPASVTLGSNLRGGAVVARQAHNLKVGGAIPSPVTNLRPNLFQTRAIVRPVPCIHQIRDGEVGPLVAKPRARVAPAAREISKSSIANPQSSILAAISFVESGHNPAAIGDNGRATGQFQMHRAAREDASRASDKLQVTCDKPGVRTTRHTSLITSDAALASAYLNILSVRFQRRTGRAPSAGELYGCYNLGFTGFQRLDFDLRRVNKKTRKAAATVQRICSQN